MYDGDDRTDASAQKASRSFRLSGGPTSVTLSTRRALGLVMLSLALGCTEPPPTAAQGTAALEVATSACTVDGDCGPGSRCCDGACAAGDCCSSEECGGRVCRDHSCQACKAPGDCSVGSVCCEGLCRSGSGCSSADCPAGA